MHGRLSLLGRRPPCPPSSLLSPFLPDEPPSSATEGRYAFRDFGTRYDVQTNSWAAVLRGAHVSPGCEDLACFLRVLLRRCDFWMSLRFLGRTETVSALAQE